ncbi:serine hydrolase [Acidisphaera sp. S103]|uniref:serine hydrolase n=1 Tax=Acidisphaera sp. S103 TaxID=1747223 RepID=UPI00131C00F7|nr:serine hydrolase [Acidisphaera sp. S103]
MRDVSIDRRSLLLAALALPIIPVPGYAQREADAGNDAAAALPDRGPSFDTTRALLAKRVDSGRDSVGYVALIRDADGPRLVAYGTADGSKSRPLDGDTVFEIGSITKVFTALLLADMVARGEVALTDRVEKYLPPEGRPKSFDGKPISLLDLVTYVSGLPRMPTNFSPQDRANPFADYTVAQLYKFLSDFTPRYYPGSHYEYSNLGFGLLGHVLSLRAGRGYEELVVSRICEPLGLNDTRITLSSSMRERLAQGHDSGLQAVPNWDLGTLAGAGALRSTANDMMRFLDACQGKRKTDLSPAIASLLEVRRQTGDNGVYVAAGWFVDTEHNDELVVKDGGTGGYATFIGYSARTGIAAVLLSNAASWSVTPRLGRHLLNTNFPLPVLHRQVAIDPAKLSVYAGRYPLGPWHVLTVTPRNGRLMVQATGQDEYEVFPEGDTRFFLRVVDAQITFELGPDGTASGLVLHQDGQDRRGVRLP